MDDTLQKAFNDQIRMEQQAAQAYQQLSIWAESQDLTGMAEWFAQQSAEEREHADIFIRHVLDRGGEVALQPLDAPRNDFTDAEDAFRAALASEERVTESIGQLYRTANEVGDHRAIPLLTRFLDEQVEEEASVRTILAELRMAAGTPAALLMLDRELPGRRGGPAPA